MAGLAQSFWLRWPGSRAWAIPVDGGRSLRGRRLLGDNKTVRGFVVMVPATGLAFLLVAWLVDQFLGGLAVQGLWDLPIGEYGLLGLWTGIFFMAGELPNSFLKRQLDVPPGGAPRQPLAKIVCFVLDRFDSVIGLMASAAVFVRTPWQLWVILLTLGSFVHWLFSVLLYLFGVKQRPA
jgi:CDP-archaeol synthase